jgi:hypothetical protein
MTIHNSKFHNVIVKPSDVEAEAPEAGVFWWKRKRRKMCCYRFHSVSKLLFEFW